MPVTKHSYIVKNVKDLAKTIRNAFRIAKSGRPGPVLVDITKDNAIGLQMAVDHSKLRNGWYPLAELEVTPASQTGIYSPFTAGKEAKVCYTLQGIRTSRPATPGIYISDGKKIVVR